MKILNVKQIREADAITCERQGISSEELLERAALQFVTHFVSDYQSTTVTKHIFCGKGNNGGDGLAIARLLFYLGHKVIVYLFTDKQLSCDCKSNLNKIQDIPQIRIEYIENLDVNFHISGIIIDALLGTGCTNSINAEMVKAIHFINGQSCIRVSVDMPSGMACDEPSGNTIVKADRVYSFQQPKLAFLLPQNSAYIKKFDILDIRIDSDYRDKVEASFFYTEKKDIRGIHKHRDKFTHKGTFGHGVLIGGSKGKMGAAVLASKSALRTGLGLLTTHIPECGYYILQQSVPEAMCSIDNSIDIFSSLPSFAENLHYAIGPGLGTSSATQTAILSLLKSFTNNGIWDADALNILSMNKSWLSYLPEDSILTPHPKEFERLAGTWRDDFEKLELLRDFSLQYKVITVLKGAYTAICDSMGTIYFNSTGNSGMSTAGSGDVLTGMLLALLTQGYTPLQSAILGVYLHGLAGNIALEKQSKESLIASDITENIGRAFKNILEY